MVALPGGIPPSMVRAINRRNTWYPDPTGFDRADCVPLAEQMAKGWFQNLQERPRRDVFRSISRTCTFEKTPGTSSFEGNRIVTGKRAEHQGKIICQDHVRTERWHYNIASTYIIKPSKLSSQTEAISENQPVQFSSRGQALSKASEILQHVSDNWALRIKSQDVRYETTWMKGLGA